MEINVDRGLYLCWACRTSGSIPLEEQARLAASVGLSRLPQGAGYLSSDIPRGSLALSGSLPEIATLEIARRGFDPEWLVRRYAVSWDSTYSRLFWPAGVGGILRSVLEWAPQKTIGVEPRGIIGQHLLRPGAHVVVTEGDYKAAAIPLPWIGVGIMGTEMTDLQVAALSFVRPASVTVCMDGGFSDAAQGVAEQLALLSPRIVHLPDGKGPDDVLRKDLLRVLEGC